MARTGSLPGKRNSGGFTLLELLLAFVVFAMSFAVVMEILSGAMRNTVRARNYTEAALIAQSVMDQVGLDIPLEDGVELQGESGIYEWDLDISNFANANQNNESVELAEMTGVELLELQLVISWGDAPRDRSVDFSTVRARLAGGGSRRPQRPIGLRPDN